MADEISTTYQLGNGLKIEDDQLVVDMDDAAIKDSMKPITSNAVKKEVGDLADYLSQI